jgi:nucleotide-binding universal stress UspA family protein
MRKIVIPTDFSENAFNALKYAVELFKYELSEFYILHAYADEVYSHEALLSEDLFEELKNNTLSNSNKELESILLQIQKISPNPRHSFKTIAAFGILVDEVNDLVNKENADVMVMGTLGKTDNRKITYGSNTLQVIKYVQCPVLCIPVNYEFEKPDNVLFPSNFRIPYQRRELKLIAELVRTYCGAIHLLYISKFPLDSYRQKDNQLFLKEQFHEINFQCHREEEDFGVEAIQKYIADKDIDMLVMVNSHHTYLESILNRSTIDQIGLHPRIPFLVLQNFYRDANK